MSKEMDSFEEYLKRQPFRQPPVEWREQILLAVNAQDASRHAASSADSVLSALKCRLGSLLWPHPVAWGGLAATWVLILTVHFSIRDTSPVLAEKRVTPSPELIAELRQQHRLLVELMGESTVADRQKAFVPKPRSERMNIWAV